MLCGGGGWWWRRRWCRKVTWHGEVKIDGGEGNEITLIRK